MWRLAGAIFKNFKNAAWINDMTISEVKSYSRQHIILGGVSYSDKVYNIYSQYKPGAPTKGIDSLICRLSYLNEGLTYVKNDMLVNNMKVLAIPLIAAGLAKDSSFIGTDLEYFKKAILPIVEVVFENSDIQVKIMHL